MTHQEFIKKALLIPFKEKGRDYDGWDCWGLVYCYYRDVLGINLPAYLDYSSTKEYEILSNIIETGKPEWTQIITPTVGDVGLFTISGKPVHIAIIVSVHDILHSEEKIGTFIEPFNGSAWNKRLEGFYKYAGRG